jgi:hypoxia up-regulated 1
MLTKLLFSVRVLYPVVIRLCDISIGAAFHGAGLSRQFKTKEIKVSDIGVHDIEAVYFASPASTNVKPRTINTVLFPAGSKVGTKKTLTFKRKEDFTLWLDYKSPPSP